MLQKIKKVIKASKLLRKLIIPLIDKRYRYHFKVIKLLNKSLYLKLLNGSTVKFYPKGQIAFGIFTKQFEKQEIDSFQRIIKPGMTIVDAGANIGLYSLIASQLIGSKGRVFSFEPSKETFQRLTDNIKLNGFNNITPFNNGLGDKPNEKLILRQDIGNEDAERYLFPNNKSPDVKLENMNTIQTEEEVIIDTLDNCLKNLNIPKINFLKIDTEGYEYYILKGAKTILQNSPEIIIFMECTELGTSRASTTQKEVFTILKDHDLNIFYWDILKRDWFDDEAGVYKAGEIWACKNKNQLT